MGEIINYADVLWERTQRHLASGEVNRDNLPAEFLNDKDLLWQKVQEVISFVNQQKQEGIEDLTVATNMIDKFHWMKELCGATESGSGFKLEGGGVLGQLAMVGMAQVRYREEQAQLSKE